MKARLKTVKLPMSATFANMQKARNVGRARGTAVRVHNNGTATFLVRGARTRQF